MQFFELAGMQQEADRPGRPAGDGSAVLLARNTRRSLLDERRNGFRLRHVDGVTALHFGDRRASAGRHLTLGRRGNHAVVGRDRPFWPAITRFVATTSSPSEVVGFCTMLTSYPSFLRILYTPSQPESSTKPPWRARALAF
jgi:hypothetical protein